MLGFLTVGLALIYTGWQVDNYRRYRKNVGAVAGARAVTGISLPRVALLVPYRNEETNLPTLIRSLAAQDYPAKRLTVYLIDDHSTDGGPALLANLPPNFRRLALADHPDRINPRAHKKSALTLGVYRTHHATLILTTDADCQWPPDGVSAFVRAFQSGADVVLGPVAIAPTTDFLSAFQALDLAAFQFLTIARRCLANGAAFAFRRRDFLAVDGYAGVDHLPSGDDVLLLHKLSSRPSTKVASAALPRPVWTRPVTSWPGLFRQRLRWAGKAGSYTNGELRLAQGLTFLLCLGIVCCLGFGTVGAGLLAWGAKAIVDYLLLRAITRRLNQEKIMRWYVATQLLYPFFLIAVGSAALLGFRAPWKGRIP